MKLRRAAKRDANQGELVRALQRLGMSVCDCSAVGDGFPDLVVGWRGRSMLVEVKNPARSPAQKALTPDQKKFRDEWRGQYAVCETVDDVLSLFG